MPPKSKQRRQQRIDGAVDRLIRWMGSVQSLAVHTLLFAFSFSLVLFGYAFGDVLLVLTTIVSLEAIYMAIFIQIAVNRNSESLEAVEEDIDEIQEDVEEIQEDVDEIQEDVEEIQEDVDEIEKDLDVIQKDVDEIEKDVDEIQKDVDEIEKEGTTDVPRDDKNRETMEQLEQRLAKLLSQLEKVKDGMK